MKLLRILLQCAGVLLLTVGASACIGDSSTCHCALNPSASKFAYVVGRGGSVSSFTINATTGGLSTVAGSPFASGQSPYYAASDPAGKFLYVSDPSTPGIFAFSINQTTGALTAIAGSPFQTESGELITALVPVVDPSGQFLYVTDFDSCDDGCRGAISAFKIAADGSLTVVQGSPYPTDYRTVGIAIHPSGQFVYAVNSGTGDISAFQVNPTSGALTEIEGSPFAVGQFILTFAAMYPSGGFLYVTGFAQTAGAGFVFPLAINSTTGAVSFTAGSQVAAGIAPIGIDVDAIDNFLYVANEGDSNGPPVVSGSIFAYRINATTGALMPIAGSPFATAGSYPSQIAVDRSCRFLYATNNNVGSPGLAADYLLGFSIDPLAGTLTAVPGSPFNTSASGDPFGIALAPHQTSTIP